MSTGIYHDALIISTYILILLWVVIVLAAVLIRKRRNNLPYYYTPTIGYTTDASQSEAYHPPVRIIRHTDSQVPLNVRETSESTTIAESHNDDVPVEWIKSGQNSATEQIVIHIEPDGAPTEDQRAIQRIIKHLQSTAAQSGHHNPTQEIPNL